MLLDRIRTVGRVSIREVRTMLTATDTSRHSGFFEFLAQKYAVFFELFGEDRVQKWITA